MALSKRLIIILLIGLLFALSGCNALGADDQPPEDPAAAEGELPPPAQPTTQQLAPTIDPNAAPAATFTPLPAQDGEGGDLAPTALPTPTPAISPTPEGEDEAAESGPPGEFGNTGAPGISVFPDNGGELTPIIVDGDGFEPNETVEFYWSTDNKGPQGDVYYELDADENGSFKIDLLIPSLAKWPGGGQPKEGDRVYLIAIGKKSDIPYWAEIYYIPPYHPETSLVQKFDNPDWGYSIELPNLWTWSWEGNATSNVRFLGPDGVSYGFVRIATSTSTSEAAAAVMPLEFPGDGYSLAGGTTGKYPGSIATTASGKVVWFIPGKGRVYAVCFLNANGEFMTIIGNSFKFLD